MNPRRWIWAAVAVQIAGLAYDAVWHGLLHRDFEAATVRQMAAHLLSVHLPIYVGVVAVLVATAGVLVDRLRWSRPAGALRVAFAGAVLSVAGEAWHAAAHLRLSTHAGPIAESTAMLGLAVVVIAVWLDGRRDRARAAGEVDDRRAA